MILTPTEGSVTSHVGLLVRLLSWCPSVERELRLLPSLVRPGGLCVDVGAAIGLYTMACAALVGRSGFVHAFEPRLSAACCLNLIEERKAYGVHSGAAGASVGKVKALWSELDRAVHL